MENIAEKLGVYDLTPVELRGGMYVKRDDLYRPFPDIPVSGGKVRQAIMLMQDNYNHILQDCDSKVYTGTGVTSPQGVIISRVAREFGFNCTVFIARPALKSIQKSNLLMNILYQGAKLNGEAGLGYENVLNSVIQKKRDNGDNFYQVRFGINLEENPKAILDSIGYQVQNLPKDLDVLVVPGGSCITMGGILRGLETYNIKVGRVIGVQISGMDRVRTVEHIMGDSTYPYELRVSKDYPYAKHVIRTLQGGVELDRVYEAKAYDYMQKYMATELQGKKVCFWVVGNAQDVRDRVYKR